VTAQDNDLKSGLNLMELLNHLQAAHSAHKNIRQNHIAGIILQISKSIRSVAESANYLKAHFLPGDETFQTMSDVIFIFHNYQFEQCFTSSAGVVQTHLWMCLSTRLFQVSILHPSIQKDYTTN
jgi:hypothetical protein